MKIGRNAVCPCGSGKKYKRCCAGKPTAKYKGDRPRAGKPMTLGQTIAIVQKQAAKKKEMLLHIGAFLLYSDAHGDAWVLEITDSDCFQIASAGESLEVPLEEDDERMIMDWSHRFFFKNKALHITAHHGKKTRVLENAPSQQLFALRKKILKSISAELRDMVHLDQ